MKTLPRGSKSFQKLNPHIFGGVSASGDAAVGLHRASPHSSPIYETINPVGRLVPAKPKPDPLPALEQKPEARYNRVGHVVVVVTLLRFGRNCLDSDNLAFAFKGLRDAVSKSLGIDDGDRRVRWQYGQVETRGKTGCVVKIECV